MNRKYGVVVILAAIWSVNFIAMNIINKQISPFATGCMVRFCTFLLLTGFLTAQGKRKELTQLNGAMPKLLCVGLLGFLLDLTSFIGFRFSDASTGTVLLKTDVVMANILTIIFLKEKFTKKDWLFTLSLLLGVCFVLGINPFDLQFHPMDIFFVLSAFFVTLNAFLIKHVQDRHKVSNNAIAYYNNIYTFALFTLTMLLTGNQGSLSYTAAHRDILALICLCGLTQALIYVFYYRGLSTLPVWIVKVILLLIPVFTMVFSVFLFGQIPTLMHLAGTVIVLGSALGILYTHHGGAPADKKIKAAS